MQSMVFLVLSVVCSDAPESSAWSDAARSFALGPVPPHIDLRTMLTGHIVRHSCEQLDRIAEARRDALASGAWRAWRDAVRQAVHDALGPMPFGAAGGPLNVRPVSRHDETGYVVENVLFESLAGLDVNASVYLPRAEQYPPPWPAVVVPVGHSYKVGRSYQVPAQVFARMGYVAVTFDPPGMAGERPLGNDHFVDGVRCYLTGHSSNRYFVIDALRCIDYLATRPDVDFSNGVAMTGVSGGGMTTMFATLLDDRITVAGPACCATPMALHPVLDQYAPCPETLAFGRFREYDDTDLLAAAMPTPTLLMAGAGDEVFTAAMSRRIAEEVEGSFAAAGFADEFAFFLDPGGHDYTVAMAVEFVKWMDRCMRNVHARTLPDIHDEDLELLPAEKLACHPRQERNIFSVNRAMARALRDQRSPTVALDAVREVAGVSNGIAVPTVRAGDVALAWVHYVQELVLEPEAGIELPATFLYPAPDGPPSSVLLYFDDRGRWTDLRTHGLLARVARFIDREAVGRAVLAVDLRGWGDTQPADLRYDVAGWGSRERWTAYVSAALGDPVLAMRIRDGLAALAYLRTRPEIDPSRIVVGGRGMGGVVALHVAALDSSVAGTFNVDGLASFESLATSERYAWPPEAFLPNVLKHYDLPELVAATSMPTLVAAPRGADKAPVSRAEAEALYRPAIDHNDAFRLRVESADDAVLEFVQDVMGG